MTLIHAFIIAVLQGVTELFPVSSLAHAVIVPDLLHWNIDQRGPAFLPFLVTLHLGTAVALLLYFWRDWLALAQGVLGLGVLGRGPGNIVRESRHIAILIVLATVPAVILGAMFESFLRRLFGTPQIAALFLVVNGLWLLAGERLRRASEPGGNRAIASLAWKDAVIIGLWQCLAFIPGISRSGVTIIGGILRGIDHEASARFSFLIGTPLIVAATVNQAWHLHKAGVTVSGWGLEILAAIVAAVTALASTAFLMRYFRSHEAWAMSPFAIYCIVFGAASFAVLYV